MVSGSALQKYMMDIEKQQHLLLNASEILNQIYMAESAILRAEKHSHRFCRSSNGKTEPLQSG
jgi:uncharacterized protein with ATP-grasp and redox domains